MSEKPMMLVINAGSTSTKLGFYRGEEEVTVESVQHPTEVLRSFALVTDELPMRREAALDFLKRQGVSPGDLSIVMSRGGSTMPVEGGAYAINDLMVDRLKNRPFVQHAGILGPVIAREIADMGGVKSYVYDSVSTDEMTPIARISGMKEITRKCLVHVLNTRFIAKKLAREDGLNYEDLNVVAAHIGGGITLALHSKGHVIDGVGDEEGPFSPDRAGGISSRMLVDLCFSGEYADVNAMHRIMRGGGGLVSYLGTADAREVERRALVEGDEYAKLIYDAMIYQIAKSIAGLATVVSGEVDFILLTGGILRSEYVAEELTKRVGFIAPVRVVAGEFEMEALHKAGLEILLGNVKIKEYTE